LASSGFSRSFSRGVFSLLNRIFVVIFGFLNVFFLVRIMPKSEIGIWVLFTSVTAILEMVRNGFIRNPLISSLVSGEEQDRKPLITASLGLHCILGVVVSILLLVGAVPLSGFWDAPELENLFYVYALNNIIFIPFLHFEYLQSAKLQFKGIFISNFVRLSILGGYIMVHFITSSPITLMELALVQLTATAVASFVGYHFAKDLIPMDRVVSKKLVKELFHFGKYTFGTNISSMFVKSTDSWMIGRLLSTAAVAVYNPAIRLANIVEVPTLAIANFVFPQVAQKMKDRGNEGVRDVYVKSVSLILAMMLPMVLPMYVFSDFLILTIFGPEYIEAAAILRVTIFYSLIIPFNRQFGTVMDALKKPKINFYLLIMVAILNIIFNYIFLKQFGVIGSAYGTLLSYCVVFVLNQWILHRMFQINTFKVLINIFSWYKFGWGVVRKRIVGFA
jgi:O-antigen/teichoic acid export membrane protein